ncbi:TetR/AcrR family transcriptional regulator C-terminal domain-containing protein [Conexibacter arvalis]|uniref:AcrR family transcriptional regulator n=1 Tax=Conexibacter arvalis TaxID=912552 RepID=A0A840I883_9ACTN|nr:AcrR family transcriptional regulator [Conexibacter arvalis]
MPNRASELEWSEAVAGGAAARGGLTRATIVAAALEIADAEGLDAVSIRRVAAALSARPMSLYTHIASKDDLVALMLDEVSAELIVPQLPSGWREAIGAIARQAFAAYLAHPWMLSAFGRGPRVGPNHLRRAEQSATAVAGLGIDPADAWTALRIVHEWTMGHALHVVTLREDAALEQQLSRADPGSFPQMAKVFPAMRGRPHDTSFDAALDVLLDGIERRFLERR